MIPPWVKASEKILESRVKPGWQEGEWEEGVLLRVHKFQLDSKSPILHFFLDLISEAH
jgi:hypothetical protein